MELQDLIEEFRNQVSDTALPCLWSDDEVLRYAIDAQDQLVRMTGGIADVTVALADIGSPQTRLQDLDVVVGQPYAALSPYILRHRTARLLTVKQDIRIINHSDLPITQGRASTTDYGLLGQSLQLDDTETGEVLYGMLGLRDGYVRWLRVPASVDTCRLSVFRLPYPRIAAQEDNLEVKEQHHLHLIKWMKHLAYSKQDGEVYDKGQAEGARAAFVDYCSTAKAEQERERYKPRQVQYGGL